MPDSNVTITAGVGTNIDTYQVGTDHRQYVIPTDHGGFAGRFATFRIPGRAGTTGQNLAAIFNAVGSTVAADVRFVGIDLYQTVVKAITVAPPIIRVTKLTTLPTNGTAGTKLAEDSAVTSSASITTFQDASADGTSSATALGFTQTGAANTLTQEFAPRFITAAGYEMADRVEMLQNTHTTIRAGEGVGIRLDYTAATQNPITDMWIVTIAWEEYTP